MLENPELDWLAAERPTPVRLDSATTVRVRSEMLAHTEAARTSARPWSFARRGGRHASHPALRAVAALAVAAAVAIVALTGGGGAGGAGGAAVHTALAGPVGHHRATVTPITRLASKLLVAPRPAGDATLVIRRQSYPGHGAPYGGADLYTDGGDYYYAPTPAGLPQAIRAHTTVNSGSADQESREIAAAEAAFTGPVSAARARMATASLDPGVKQRSLKQTLADAPPALRLKLKALAKRAASQPAMSAVEQENNMIWINSVDALQAGAGNPRVRAGILHLFASIPQITVTRGHLDGEPTLVLQAAVFGPGMYRETLTINADSGVPIELVGGNLGRRPGVVVHYSVSRVTVAGVEAGSSHGG